VSATAAILRGTPLGGESEQALFCLFHARLSQAYDYLVVLRDGTELKLSRGYRAKVEASLGQPL
jgi:hypothetical protein